MRELLETSKCAKLIALFRVLINGYFKLFLLNLRQELGGTRPVTGNPCSQETKFWLRDLELILLPMFATSCVRSVVTVTLHNLCYHHTYYITRQLPGDIL